MNFDQLAGVSQWKPQNLEALQTKPGQHKVLVIFEERLNVESSNLAGEATFFFLVVRILLAYHSWYIFSSTALSEGHISDAFTF